MQLWGARDTCADTKHKTSCESPRNVNNALADLTLRLIMRAPSVLNDLWSSSRRFELDRCACKLFVFFCFSGKSQRFNVNITTVKNPQYDFKNHKAAREANMQIIF
jgi:hypothetical protein